mgnify:CR=1 FL=1
MRGRMLLLLAFLPVAGCDSPQDGAPLPPPASTGRETSAVEEGPGIDPSLPPLRIALIPLENPERLIDDVQPAMTFLQQSLRRRIEYRVTLDYSTAVAAMSSGEADVSFMSPLPYVLAHQQTGAKAVLGEVYAGRPWYVSKIFVRRESGISSIEGLAGKSVAYVDPISSSGFMYPHDVFARAGLEVGDASDPAGNFFSRVFFAGGDQQAMQALADGHVDAAGTGEFAINLLPLARRDQVVSIAESVRIPSHCIVVRRDLDATLEREFVGAMMALNEPPNRHLLAKLYGTEGYVEVTHETYASVEEMARKYGFVR